MCGSQILVISKAFSRKNKRRKIGVCGSILIDVIAATDDELSADAIGEVGSLHIGGCAYNMAYYVRKLGLDVSVFSVLRNRSVLTPFILKKLQKEGIQRRFIKLEDDIDEGIFVAHRVGTDVTRAVTSVCFGTKPIDEKQFRQFVSEVDLVLCDFGLSADQLNVVLSICAEKEVKVFCNGTSDSRIKQLQSIDESKRMFALVMNAKESQSALGDLANNITDENADEIRSICRAENVIITMGSQGMKIVRSDNKVKQLGAVSVAKTSSTVGAGDALTACAAASSISFSRDAVLDISIQGGSQFEADLKNVMPKVLSTEGATSDSHALFDPSVVRYGFRGKTAFKQDPVLLYLKRENWVSVGVMLGIVLTTTFGILSLM